MKKVFSALATVANTYRLVRCIAQTCNQGVNLQKVISASDIMSGQLDQLSRFINKDTAPAVKKFGANALWYTATRQEPEPQTWPEYFDHLDRTAARTRTEFPANDADADAAIGRVQHRVLVARQSYDQQDPRLRPVMEAFARLGGGPSSFLIDLVPEQEQTVRVGNLEVKISGSSGPKGKTLG
jgi:hypothetical protein